MVNGPARSPQAAAPHRPDPRKSSEWRSGGGRMGGAVGPARAGAAEREPTSDLELGHLFVLNPKDARFADERLRFPLGDASKGRKSQVAGSFVRDQDLHAVGSAGRATTQRAARNLHEVLVERRVKARLERPHSFDTRQLHSRLARSQGVQARRSHGGSRNVPFCRLPWLPPVSLLGVHTPELAAGTRTLVRRQAVGNRVH